jgi:hypothetical protein
MRLAQIYGLCPSPLPTQAKSLNEDSFWVLAARELKK